jgi:hypothetical protein
MIRMGLGQVAGVDDVENLRNLENLPIPKILIQTISNPHAPQKRPHLHHHWMRHESPQHNGAGFSRFED